MALWKFVALLALMLSVCVADLQEMGQKKLNRMRKLREKATDGIIQFSPEQYEYVS